MNILKLLKVNNFDTIYRNCSQNVNPLKRTLRIIKNEIPYLFKNEKQTFYPEHVDVVIIGSGVIGASIAYWFKAKCGPGLSVAVLEKDFSFKKSMDTSGFTGISQHYSVIENALLSQFSAEFMRTVKDKLIKDMDVCYMPHSNLVLANDKYAELLEQNVTFQKENGIKNELLTPENIKKRYPWINVQDIKLGCIATESEGWFDPWSLQKNLMLKSFEMGALYVNCEATGFDIILQKDMLIEGIEPGSYTKLDKVKYRTTDGEEHFIKFAICILTGSSAIEVAKFANIGTGPGLKAISLPVEKRKNRVFCIEHNNKNKRFSLNTPLIKDVNGVWIRKNGFDNSFICGHNPLVYDATKDELSNEEYFQSIIQPAIMHRIPDLNDIKIISAKTEMFDCNKYDETGILGPHPYYSNLLFATGFGNLGIEHAPGIGRAITELVIDTKFTTIDLQRFGFDRLITDRPVVEVNCY